jgi:hypothetical protein
MAKDKKSFILYADLKHTVDKLPDDKAGELFKLILSYVNDENPNTEDLLLSIAFEPIKRQLKRDLEAYEEKRENQSLKGREGNLKRWHKDLFKKYEEGKLSLEEAESIANNRKTSLPDKTASGTIAKIADTVNVTVTDTDNDININFSEFWNLYNKKTGRKDCEKKWNKLKDSEREEIIKTLPTYVKSTPDIQFRKNPITYLNQRTWEDELSETRERTDYEKYIAGEIEKPNIRMGL